MLSDTLFVLIIRRLFFLVFLWFIFFFPLCITALQPFFVTPAYISKRWLVRICLSGNAAVGFSILITSHLEAFQSISQTLLVQRSWKQTGTSSTACWWASGVRLSLTLSWAVCLILIQIHENKILPSASRGHVLCHKELYKIIYSLSQHEVPNEICVFHRFKTLLFFVAHTLTKLHITSLTLLFNLLLIFVLIIVCRAGTLGLLCKLYTTVVKMGRN